MYTKKQFLVAAGIFSFFYLFLVGCAKNVTPIVLPPKPTLTEISPTPSEDPKPLITLEVVTTESTPHVSPYIEVRIVDVEVRFLETNPVQVEIVIRGSLPDQCTYNFYSVENRNGQKVKVSLDGIHSADTNCLQTDQKIEYVILLGRDMPEAERGFSPGDYELTVNNYQTSFSIK
jgi:hypothetical protein